MGGQFDAGPIAGTAFTANYFFDAPPDASSFGFAEGSWALSLLSLNLGGSQILTLHNPGINFVLQGGGNLFGPNWNVPAHVLPAGLASWSFNFIPQTLVTFAASLCPAGSGKDSSGNCVVFGRFTNSSITPLPPSTIPEPTSLLLGLGAFAGLAVRRWRASAPASRRDV
jgi:hypothetical protein